MQKTLIDSSGTLVRT